MMVEKIVLGSVQFGMGYGINNKTGKPSEKEVSRMLDYARENKIVEIDTADGYGAAQKILGRYNQRTSDNFLFNTKFKSNNIELVTQVDRSLYQLHVDSIHIYYYHSFQDYLHHRELRDQLHQLKIAGKIDKIGLSVYENSEMLAASEDEMIDVIQVPFNLLDNYSQKGELIKFAKKKEKEVQVRSVFLQGLFFLPPEALSQRLAPLAKHLNKIQKLSREVHVSISQLALNYVLQQKDIDRVIIGVESMDQLETNILNSTKRISSSIMDSINEIIVEQTELLHPKNW
jgi:uncharacterized protein